jgi:hypothetical protein
LNSNKPKKIKNKKKVRKKTQKQKVLKKPSTKKWSWLVQMFHALPPTCFNHGCKYQLQLKQQNKQQSSKQQVMK